ncbi:hypothetical protein PF003_g360 [Phytophthora fragariae]|nr:hypothetical protein PF003_g360 [Phytophthora fragariae]
MISRMENDSCAVQFSMRVCSSPRCSWCSATNSQTLLEPEPGQETQVEEVLARRVVLATASPFQRALHQRHARVSPVEKRVDAERNHDLLLARSTIIYSVIVVIVVLFGFVAFFVWKRNQNRKRSDGHGGYGPPSTTARTGISRGTSQGGNTVFELRMESTGYSSHHSKDKKAAHYQPQQRVERPPQWPANGAPTYTQQQQQS